MGVLPGLFNEIHYVLESKKPKNCLSLGYPDMLVPPLEGVKISEKSIEIEAYHGIKGPFMDSVDYFRSRGCDLVVADYSVLRGPEIIADLNAPAALGGPYDLIVDPGTLEHCFNVFECLRNILVAASEGAIIIHWNPLNMCNHGFYNFSPTFYYDFYEANGGEIISETIWDNSRRELPIHIIDNPVVRMNINHPNCSILTIVKMHTKSFGNIAAPIQSKYKAMLNAN